MRLLAIVTLLGVVACGGGIDAPSSSSSNASSSGASDEPSGPPSSVTPPAASGSAPAEQESVSPPEKVGEPPSPGTSGAPFHLVLSSRAPAHQPIYMDVEIDGAAVVSGSLAGGKTYTFDFMVAPGAHVLAARAKHSIHETTESFAFDATGERWGVLNASAGRCDPCGPASMTWEVKTAP